MKTIGIVGSSRRNKESDYRKVLKAFEEVYEEGDRICSGGCPKGGDRFAQAIAESIGLPILIYYPARWKHGPLAGLVRNTSIAGESDILIACVVEGRTGDTEDIIKKWRNCHHGVAPILVK